MRNNRISTASLTGGVAICVLGALAPTVAFGDTPQISGVRLLDSERIQDSSRLRIIGTGFDDKANAPAVLFDQVSRAYQNGNLNDIHASLNEGDSLPIGVDGDEGALWSTSTETVSYSTNGPKRYKKADASYALDGENAWVGGVVPYGGPGGWDTPTDNSQLYVSWWFMNEFNSTYYWRFSPNGQKGEFIPKEKLVIEGVEDERSEGVYVGIDEEGLHNAVLYDHWVGKSLAGKKIVGVSSGASTVFPTEFRAGSGYGYQTPGSKLARIWDDPDGTEGIRASVSTNDIYTRPSRRHTEPLESAQIYHKLSLPGEEWTHLEVELDTDKGRMRVYEDSKLVGEDFFSPEGIYSGRYSPTLSLLGTNGHMLKLQKAWISEVYFDSSIQRVVIGDAPNFDDVTHYELQRVLDWSDSEIEIAVHLGALDFGKDLYVYTFDKDGVVNERGAPLCSGDDCPVPPSRINLVVD